MPKLSTLEVIFIETWVDGMLKPDKRLLPVPHCPFDKTRRHIDFAWPRARVGLEINGGSFVGGRHNRGTGQENDMQKMNDLQLSGWVVLQAGTSMIRDNRKLRPLMATLKRLILDRSS